MTMLTAAIPLAVLILITWAQDIATCGLLPQYIVPLMHDSSYTHNWPWHAAIYHRETDLKSSYKCGGTLIATNWILTAAHCVLIERRQITVSLGRLQLGANEQNEQFFSVDEIIVHVNFKKQELYNDIALVRLSGKAVVTLFVRPICLWKSSKTDVSNIVDKYGTVIGWGKTETNDLSTALREASFKVVSHIDCLQSNRPYFGHYLTNTTFCAGLRNGTSPCEGDSGGSMTFVEDGVYYIRGIVSGIPSKTNHTTQQQDCDTMEYATYTDVAKYLDWIGDKMDTDTFRKADDSSIFPQTMVADPVRVYEAPTIHRIRSHVKEFCLDVVNANRNSGTRVQAAHCNGNAAQDWTVDNNDNTIRAFGKCLDVADGSVLNGARVLINDCNGTASQHWKVSSTHDIVNIAADSCLDIRMPVGDGARAQIWECTGVSNQKWNLG